jgi:hypothetical protein|eukprot:COSAG06_NODE_307_length_17801_cov_6.184386_6_plen_456_part_00
MEPSSNPWTHAAEEYAGAYCYHCSHTKPRTSTAGTRSMAAGRPAAAAAALLLALAALRHADALDARCNAALTPETNATGLGRCVALCINAAATLPAQSEWSPAGLGQDCAECAAELTQCKPAPETTGDGGWLEDRAAPAARDFTCGGVFRWTNTTRATTGVAAVYTSLSLRLSDMCYPADCADGDITDLLADAKAVIAAHTPDTVSYDRADKACDLLGSFVNEDFAWVIFALGILLIAASCLLPNRSFMPYIALLWMLYIFTLIDLLVGLGFLGLAVVLTSESDFPQYLIFSVLGVGVIHLVIAIVLWCGGRKQGTPCVLAVARGLAFLLGPLGGVLGIVFQVSGKDMLIDTFDQVGVELSQEKRGEIEDFMQTTHTLLVCVFFLMMGVHCSTIPVSRSVRDYRYENRGKAAEDEKMDEARDGQRREREKAAFQDKYRKKIAKEDKGKPKPFASV